MTGIRKRIQERRERNKQLGEREAKARCGMCRIELPTKVFLRWADPLMYCSADCLADANERDGRKGQR